MNFKELLEKKNDLITRAEEILDSAKTETRELTDEEVTEITDIKENVRKIDETLKLDEEVRSLEKMEIKEDEEPKEEDEMEEKRSVEQIAEMEKRAFENYIRGTVNERNDVNLTLTDNGAVIPETIVDWIIRKVYDICPILERSQKFNVKGKLEVPYYPADSNNITVAYQTEFTDMESTTGSFNTVELSGYLAGALTKVSRSLVNNTDVDIVGFVVDEMAQAIARFIEKELLVGTPAHDSDPAKVLGLSTLSNALTLTSASAITADDIVRLQGKVKDYFQRDAIWIMNPATRDALRLLKDNVGHYMLNPDFTSGFGYSMLGKPVYVSDNMPTIGGGNSVIFYGDMKGLGTKFNEGINIEVLRERYAPQHALGIVGWFEFDGKVIDEQQIAVMKMGTASLG